MTCRFSVRLMLYQHVLKLARKTRYLINDSAYYCCSHFYLCTFQSGI